MLLALVLLGTAGCQRDVTCGPLDLQSAPDVAAAARCTVVAGDLRIVESAVVGLDELRHLRTARYVVIAGNANLESLAGLSGLRSVQGVTIQYNPWLTSLRGLEGLRKIDEGLVVLSNTGLRSLDGLQNLEHVPALTVADNPRLENTAALATLRPRPEHDIQGVTVAAEGR